MSDGFAEMIPMARQFFAELAANNDRAWFEGQKARYLQDIRKPAELLAEVFGDELRRLTGGGVTAKVFRINRDVRFSKDKSPYAPHLHILWSAASDDEASWFFGLSPAYFSLSTGRAHLSSEGLAEMRGRIAANPAPWLRAVDAVLAIGGELTDWGDPPLKRVPKPWDDSHPAANLLRRKSLILTYPLEGADLSHGLVPAMRHAAQALLPFARCY